MNDYLMKLKDGYIKSVDYETQSYAGCPTRDYGSVYISDIEIELKNFKIKIYSEQMYDFAITEGMLMKLLLHDSEAIHNMTEEEFFGYIREWARKFKNEGTRVRVKVE